MYQNLRLPLFFLGATLTNLDNFGGLLGANVHLNHMFIQLRFVSPFENIHLSNNFSKGTRHLGILLIYNWTVRGDHPPVLCQPNEMKIH
jgi:hypothetical protein